MFVFCLFMTLWAMSPSSTLIADTSRCWIWTLYYLPFKSLLVGEFRLLEFFAGLFDHSPDSFDEIILGLPVLLLDEGLVLAEGIGIQTAVLFSEASDNWEYWKAIFISKFVINGRGQLVRGQEGCFVWGDQAQAFIGALCDVVIFYWNVSLDLQGWSFKHFNYFWNLKLDFWRKENLKRI